MSFVGWCTGNRRVVGFVPVWAAKLEQRSNDGYGCDRGSGTFAVGKPADSALSWITLGAGQRLLDKLGGRLIGLVDSDVDAVDDGAPWVKLRTRWGRLRVAVTGSGSREQ